jgi:predicted permease
VVTTPYGVADPATTAAHTDGTGNAARFSGPYGLVIDGLNLYVSDANNNCIRKIVISSGVVTTPYGVADPATTSGNVDGLSNAARFSTPLGIISDGTNLYVSDSNNLTFRKIYLSTGYVTTLDIGSSTSLPSTAGFQNISGVILGPS